MSKKLLRAALRTLEQANSFAEWQSAAEEADRLSGAKDWRADDASPLIDAPQMRAHIQQIKHFLHAGDFTQLRAAVYESLYRHMGDVANPELYAHALAGTKEVVEAYLLTVESALSALAQRPFPGLSEQQKAQALRLAAFNLGRPALLLSGGASLGFVHLGVAKALHDQKLLPDVISGSSMGALVAAGLGSRTPAELAQLLGDTGEIYRFGLQFLGPRAVLSRGAILDNRQLLRCAWKNAGNYTFAEAHARSGISLGISVSPARSRQKPRLLSHLSSPDVLLPRAALASCAIPGLFPPVQLRSRDARGRHAYLPDDRWVDGSVQSDLPMQRLARLFNVNQFIVSQTNPHSLPFLASRHGRGIGSLLMDVGLSSSRAQLGAFLKVARERVRQPAVHNLLEHASALADQRYRGDINIHPPLSLWLYRRMLSNPTVGDLQRYTRIGERITWPKIAMVRNMTRISRLVHQLGRAPPASQG